MLHVEDDPVKEAPPASAAGPQLLAFPDTTERRLRLALRRLEAALADQRTAVAGFRQSIGELDGVVTRLGTRAQLLQDRLADAAAQTVRAQAASQELMRTAEKLEQVARR
ncbi:hypothetical protein [Falsiroseomonas oryzae]|uniref:hypothetical protein n=1 Tax=Falsiroseomonas oryzae TaxID=2766473 RepID=UPI0022EACF35|nr:hypothetical protein [Roseomonas sp. MO-31]